MNCTIHGLLRDARRMNFYLLPRVSARKFNEKNNMLYIKYILKKNFNL